MNVGPGDLARIVHPDMDGKLVSVLSAAPDRSFTLPDGASHKRPTVTPAWVCESFGSPFRAPFGKPFIHGWTA